MSLTVEKRVTLRQTVDQFSEDLVNRADQTLSQQRMKKLEKPKKKPHHKTQYNLTLSQLNTFLGVTLETDSPAVVVNWVRYQMGRSETRYGWENSGLGKQIIEDIKYFETSARQVAEKVFNNEMPTPDEIRQAHIALIRRYAGYLKRWFVARGGQS